MRVAFALTLLCFSSLSTAFYIPGVQPRDFARDEAVDLKVNALTSTHTQVPRDYYRLPFCQPADGPEMVSENLGEFLTGNKIQSSPYEINMLQESYCKKLCMISPTKLEAAKLRLHIRHKYHHNWIIDNMPSAAIGVGKDGKDKKRYSGGFPIGFTAPDTNLPYIYNHANIFLQYHPTEEGYRVVGFAVEPLSIEHKFKGGYSWNGKDDKYFEKELDTCTPNQHMTRANIPKAQIVRPGTDILFTYDVHWEESDVHWSSRWDIYLSEGHLVPPQVHWYSITNSILVVLFLSLLVISILVRNLKRDIAAYNALAALADEEKDEEMDESGWKLVHADVFRPPDNHPMLFCVLTGTGTQLCLTILFAIILSAIGFTSPARRGSLVNAFLILYMLLGVVAGYVSSRLYKAFRGRQWQLCTVITAVFFPGICYTVFLFFNLILWALHSSGSAPFLDVLILAAMWCCISIPLVFFGAFFGYKAEAIEFPTVTSTIARAIPEPPPLLNPKMAMLLTGIIPFAAAYVELFFIMTSLWMDQFYYVFGFTLIVYLILLITCAEITVLLVYYQLCAENHRWWWFSFFAPGSTALYTFVYSIFWFRGLEPSRMLMTYLLYFGYMFLLCFSMMTVFGTVGAMTSLWFTRKIFGTIKVD